MHDSNAAKIRHTRLRELLGDDEWTPANGREAMDEALDRGDAKHFTQAVRRDNSCTKTCYTSKKQARKAAINRLNKGANADRLRTYWCDLCKAFHMTSSFHRDKSHANR